VGAVVCSVFQLTDHHCPSDKSEEDKHIPEHPPVTYSYEEGDGGLSLDERWREHWKPRPVWYDMLINAPAVRKNLYFLSQY
jgi:hypothetical protein